MATDLVAGRWPVSKCKSVQCGAPIVWARTARGKRAPIDAKPAPDGRFRLEDHGGPEPVALYTPPGTVDPSPPLHHNHWATCASAPQFRRSR